MGRRGRGRGSERATWTVGHAVTVLMAALLAACAEARPAPEPPPSSVSFDVADLDHDGTVTVDEWQERGEALFDALDVDGSDDLDLVELDVGGPALEPLFEAPLAPDLVDGWFTRTDTDGNGRIARDEWLVMRRGAFVRADRNQDGRIGRAQADEARYLTVLGS